ncbi:helix-turn-helix transcriptional regulator [Paenibacillus sp. 19GGS1-52]|uniref:helix-turn-helix transcriptional regulator n=1 Tax=Paenibacillus sp. 19GGS1-52 TaxID=2758563 RepID=UPI001EFC245F|nr:helix-turn-helix domain-containing protein [Paenibacillus sp. 19GGS1-52]ULO06115.1 helix-turn-helix transcriptional regulator [Paenibacillus sp. 19GGS1-52]
MPEALHSEFFIEQLKRTGPFSMDSDHVHDSYEIYYLLAGERNYYINNLVYSLRKGDLLFINKNELHRTTAKGTARHERILINFEEVFLQKMMAQVTLHFPFMTTQSMLLRPDAHEQGVIENILNSMQKEQAEHRAQHNLYLQTLLLQLFIEMGRIQELQREAIAPENNEKQIKVYEIIDYLQTHYGDKLTLAQLSESFYISSTYLCRLFKQTTGFTIIEYLNYIRIQKAQQQLRESNAKVTQIAEDTDFDSIAHFGRVFKQIAKRSPLQYRKQNR